MNSYYDKYMKYKSKYISLKSQKGGGIDGKIIGFYMKDSYDNLYLIYNIDKYDIISGDSEDSIRKYLTEINNSISFDPDSRYIIGKERSFVYKIDIQQNIADKISEQKIRRIHINNLNVGNTTERLMISLNYNYVVADFKNNYFIDPKTFNVSDKYTAINNINQMIEEIDKKHEIEITVDVDKYDINGNLISITVGDYVKLIREIDKTKLSDLTDKVQNIIKKYTNKNDITDQDIINFWTILKNPTVVPEKRKSTTLDFEMEKLNVDNDVPHIFNINLYTLNKQKELTGFMLCTYNTQNDNECYLAIVSVLKEFRGSPYNYCYNMMDKLLNYLKKNNILTVKLSNVGGIQSCKCYLNIAKMNKWSMFVINQSGTLDPINDYDDNYCENNYKNEFVFKYLS